ncbi:MAG: molybdopterin-guanine dinucleotide biosynthesis protein B [Gemmatimonadales bacterium]|nr:molybdopterin-guanine dinucleotide biosynthesis protein B [Gemmatimonadales bacterium]
MTRNRLPHVGFVGTSGSGKTTLLERVLPILTDAGVRVGVLKHARAGVLLDKPGKDSFRAREAGAAQVLLAARDRWALMAEQRDPLEEPGLHEMLPRFFAAELDVVLVEGFAHEPYPKIEVWRPAHARAPLCWPSDPSVLACATDAAVPPASPVPLLPLNSPDVVARFVVEALLAQGATGPIVALRERLRPTRTPELHSA